MLFVNKNLLLKIVGIAAAIFLFGVWIYFEFKYKPVTVVNNTVVSNISKIVLITRDGERDREWYLDGLFSLLVGKNTTTQEADIDLSENHFSEYIATTHATLNFSEGFWYIEDLGSVNGTGIKKKDEEYALKMKPHVAYKLDVGDIIYISKIKLYLR